MSTNICNKWEHQWVCGDFKVAAIRLCIKPELSTNYEMDQVKPVHHSPVKWLVEQEK